MEFDLDFPLDGFYCLGDLISQDSFPFLGADADLENMKTEQQVQADKMEEGIQAHDLSSLLELFEEASQSLDGIEFAKDDSTLQRSKSLPASRVVSATNSPASTPPATPPPCVLDKIRARHGDSAKRKSTIMLPMGALAKHSRGKAKTLEMSAPLLGSSKLQRILSRNNPGAAQSTVMVSLSQASQPLGAVGTAEKQKPVFSTPNRVKNSGIISANVTGVQNVTEASSNASVCSSRGIVQTSAVNLVSFQNMAQSSCVPQPINVFSSQSVMMGSNIVHPVPLILSAVGPNRCQQNIPLQFVVASAGPSARSIVIDAQSSTALQVSGAATFRTTQASNSRIALSLPKVARANTGKPPPLEIKKASRTHYTTVNTRAEGIPLHVLDSVMDHDYCANSPRRVIIDEFELDLSPTKPVHKVRSLPTMNLGSSQASRELDMRKKPSMPLDSPVDASQDFNFKDSALSVSTSAKPLLSNLTASDMRSVLHSSAIGKPSPELLQQKQSHVGGSAVTGSKVFLCIPKGAPLVELLPATTLVQPSQVFRPVKTVQEHGVVNLQHPTYPSVVKPEDAATEACVPQTAQQHAVTVDIVTTDVVGKDLGGSVGATTLCSVEKLNNSEKQKQPIVSDKKSGLTCLEHESQEKCATEQGCEELKSQPLSLLSMPMFEEEEVPSLSMAVIPKSQVQYAVKDRGTKPNLEPPENVGGQDSNMLADASCTSITCHEDETTCSFQKKSCTASAETPTDEILDDTIVPQSPSHCDVPCVPSTSSITHNPPVDEEMEMYTEEDLAQADQEGFISFEEEDEKQTRRSRGRGMTARGNRNSRRARRWRPGNSPVKEDSSSFFNKIPSYYTALHTPQKTGRKELTADGLEGMSIADFIPPDHSPTHDSLSSTFSKLPAYHSCFTNSTKYDDVADYTSYQESDHNSSKPVYSFAGALDDSRHSRSRSRSRSGDRSSSRGRSRKRLRSASDSSRSGSLHHRKRSKRSHSSASESDSSRSSSASRSCSSSRSRSRRRGRSSEDSSFRQEQKQKDKIRKMEERKVMYVGRIPENYTRRQLRKRFERFGQIEDVSVHFRETGDNYGFVTFYYTCDAYAAIDKGNENPDDMQFDLCFGGRRHFCANDYADLDGNLVIEEEYTPMPAKDPVGFDELLKQAQQKLKQKW